MAAIYLPANPGKHAHVKHIENKYHFVRTLVREDKLVTQHVGTNDQLADVMTKGLARVKFQRFRSLIG